MKRTHGFTLLEMAMVLLIVGLLIGGLLGPISAQVEQRRVSDTQKALEEIKAALLGYAAIHRSLPCPSREANPASPDYGEPVDNCDTAPLEGYLPWKALGVAETDAWGLVRTTPGSPWTGYWRYRVDAAFSTPMATITPITLDTVPANNLTVQNNAGTTLTSIEPEQRPVAIIYSTGPNGRADGRNAPMDNIYEQDVPRLSPAEFDDITVWLSPPALFNHLVAAGRLP